MLPLLVAIALARTADIATEQATVVEEMTEGLDVSLTWLPCGQENAFYFPGTGDIFLCLEMLDTPAALFVAAHEAGHAVVFQNGIDPGPERTAHEDAADELAALYLIGTDRLDAVVGGARWFMGLEGTGEGGPHSSHLARAGKLLCLADGAEDGSIACQVLLAVTRAKWTVLLK